MMYAQFNSEAGQVMQFAEQEARRLNHEYIGTEHILLGLLNAYSSAGATVLKHFCRNLNRVRREIEKIIYSPPDSISVEKLPETPRAKKAIEYAIQEAHGLNQAVVGSEHLLLGLFREDEGVAGVVLRNLGLKLGELRNQVRGSRTPPPLMPSEEEIFVSLPAEIQEKVRELDTQLEQLTREKQDVVGLSDFERAATLRDRLDRLRKKRQQIIREAH
jgi:ATP-dependent Clp protease ATP-binding subunit ClpA